MHTTVTQLEQRKKLDETKWREYRGILSPRMAWMLYYEEKKSVHKVCEKFGISRKTFYKWWNRFVASGYDPESLKDESRRPHTSPKSTPHDIVEHIVEAKTETGFGPRRLKIYLSQKHKISLSEHTIWKLLKKHYGDEPFHENGSKGNDKEALPGDTVQFSVMQISAYTGEEHVQYTAVDVCTHLRISKIYYRHCSQSASDFLNAVLEQYPFKVKEVQTLDDHAFTNGFHLRKSSNGVFEPFRALLERHKIRHTVLNPDIFESGVARTVECIDKEEFYTRKILNTPDELVKEAETFFEFFNNHRRNDELSGLTPLQKLKEFPEFRHISYFITPD